MENPNNAVTTIITGLEGAGLFSGLSSGKLSSLAAQCFLKKVNKGQIIFRRGDPCHGVYLIEKGSIAEYAGGPNELEIVVKVRKKGDYFGETGMLIDESQLVTTVAIENGLLIGIPEMVFKQYLWSEITMTQFLVKTLVLRLKDAGECQVTFALMSASARLSSTLLRLEQESGKDGIVPVTQDYLAQSCGLVRQTVARLLRDWREMGWVITQHQRIEIKDRAALVRLIITAQIE